MPYLHCPQCRRTAWVRDDQRRAPSSAATAAATLDLAHAGDVRFLTAAVRERFARDARAGASVKRFVRRPTLRLDSSLSLRASRRPAAPAR